MVSYYDFPVTDSDLPRVYCVCYHATRHFTNASSAVILASSSATAGVLGAATMTPEPDFTSSISYPLLAVATHWMYLKRVPLLAWRGGGLQAFLPSSHSSSKIWRLMV